VVVFMAACWWHHAVVRMVCLAPHGMLAAASQRSGIRIPPFDFDCSAPWCKNFLLITARHVSRGPPNSNALGQKRLHRLSLNTRPEEASPIKP